MKFEVVLILSEFDFQGSAPDMERLQKLYADNDWITAFLNPDHELLVVAKVCEVIFGDGF